MHVQFIYLIYPFRNPFERTVDYARNEFSTSDERKLLLLLSIFATFTWPDCNWEPYSALQRCTCPRISQSKTNRFTSQTNSNSPRMFNAQSFDFKALFNKYSLHNNTYLIYGRPFNFYSSTFRYLNIFIIVCEMRAHCIVYRKMTVKMKWAQSPDTATTYRRCVSSFCSKLIGAEQFVK